MNYLGNNYAYEPLIGSRDLSNTVFHITYYGQVKDHSRYPFYNKSIIQLY